MLLINYYRLENFKFDIFLVLKWLDAFKIFIVGVICTFFFSYFNFLLYLALDTEHLMLRLVSYPFSVRFLDYCIFNGRTQSYFFSLFCKRE